MRSRNVIISLLFVLVLILLFFIRVNYWEPRKKLVFNRNPSRIEYSNLALCQMDCYNFNANDMTSILRNGRIVKEKTNMNEKPFPKITINGVTKNKMIVNIEIIQIGRVAKIESCYHVNDLFVCNCLENKRPGNYN